VSTVIDERHEAAGDDLLSDLVVAEVDGERLTKPEVYDIVLQIILAGNETTFRSMGTILFALVTHPDQLDIVREDPSLLSRAVEEGLRWDPPAHIDPRAACKDLVLGGQEVHEGDVIMVCLAAANRDKRHYDDPDEFKIMRESPRPHLAFAAGPHFCLGAHLARLELEVSLKALIGRLSNLRLDSDALPGPAMQGGRFRGPTHLHLLFDLAPTTGGVTGHAVA
jgi:cytochrome P450